MIILSIDLETTGLDPQKNQIIEFGAVIYDFKTKLRESCSFIVSHNEYTGSAFAIGMNARIFEAINNKAENVIWYNNLISNFHDFLFNFFSNYYHPSFFTNKYQKFDDFARSLIIAGKNPQFDFSFLIELEKKYPLYYGTDYNRTVTEFINLFHRRKLDPAILYTDLLNDQTPPSLEECKKRAGFKTTTVSHCAVEDANDVMDLLIHYFEKK